MFKNTLKTSSRYHYRLKFLDHVLLRFHYKQKLGDLLFRHLMLMVDSGVRVSFFDDYFLIDIGKIFL